MSVESVSKSLVVGFVACFPISGGLVVALGIGVLTVFTDADLAAGSAVFSVDEVEGSGKSSGSGSGVASVAGGSSQALGALEGLSQSGNLSAVVSGSAGCSVAVAASGSGKSLRY